tara:strand:+ start:21352 stop:21822 length:471 start_codon:yes stop_codon:yes gene_type:complete
MKIEIDIDIESIVREALKKKQSAGLNSLIEEGVSIPVEAPTNSRSKWEYGRRNGRRRSPEEMALHEEERRLGRRLTPEEKGAVKGKVSIEDSIETKVKEDTIRKDRIQKLAEEGLAAASKELEAERLDKAPESGEKVIDTEIPKTEDLTKLDSLFS